MAAKPSLLMALIVNTSATTVARWGQRHLSVCVADVLM